MENKLLERNRFVFGFLEEKNSLLIILCVVFSGISHCYHSKKNHNIKWKIYIILCMVCIRYIFCWIKNRLTFNRSKQKKMHVNIFHLNISISFEKKAIPGIFKLARTKHSLPCKLSRRKRRRRKQGDDVVVIGCAYFNEAIHFMYQNTRTRTYTLIFDVSSSTKFVTV